MAGIADAIAAVVQQILDALGSILGWMVPVPLPGGQEYAVWVWAVILGLIFGVVYLLTKP